MNRLTDMRQIPRNVGVLVLVAGLLGACATPGSRGGASDATLSPTPPATELTITVTSSPGARAQFWTLSCDPASGTHPKPASACAFVTRASARLLAPVPANQACTQIFGGPELATVKGTWRGEPVDARLARNNGCEISRWDKVKPLLGAA